MLSPIESFAHCDKAVTLQDTQISSDGRAITSQFLGKLGDALLCFTPKNTLQKHILSDLQTTFDQRKMDEFLRQIIVKKLWHRIITFTPGPGRLGGYRARPKCRARRRGGPCHRSWRWSSSVCGRQSQ